MTKKSIAYIIGNGTTRSALDLEALRRLGNGTIYGCNALYRDFWPDRIVAMDPLMVSELESSDFPETDIIVPSPEGRLEPIEYTGSVRRANNAGMIAMDHAIQNDHNFLYCIGLDFVLEQERLNVGNLYDNSPGYGPQTRASYQDTQMRCGYFEWFVNQHRHVHFRFLFPRDSYVFRPIGSNNVSVQFFDAFWRQHG